MLLGTIVYAVINSVILMLMSIGFNLTFGISGVSNFAYGALYILAAFVTPFPLFPGVCGSAAPMRRRSYTGPFLAATGLSGETPPVRGLAGSLSYMPLPELVEFLARRAVTGSLTCERGAVRKTVYMREGSAVGAASTDPREFLGQLLINFGHIDEEQLAKAFRTQQETRIRLGKVLTMVGLVQPRVLRESLSIKIRETLLDVSRWESGVFRVDEEPPAAAEDELAVTVPLSDILKEAEFRATAWDAVLARFPTSSATLIVDDSRIPASAGEGTIDGKLLMLAASGRTIDAPFKNVPLVLFKSST